jgi:hypothetical protein
MTPSNQTPANDADKAEFETFYRKVFLKEHQQTINIALHQFGTLIGLVFVVWVLTMPLIWYPALLLFPLVHAAPGLVGHRLFERNAVVGDARWQRKDYPMPWFVAANHRMAFERLLGRKG